jgi:hypothetical protein
MNKNKIISLCLMVLLGGGSLKAMNFTPDNDPRWLGDQLVNGAEFGDLDRIQKLLAEGASINHKCYMGGDFNTALMQAARFGHLETSHFLIQNGAQINIANKHGWTALKLAVSNGHLELCKLLIEKGADVNSRDSLGDTTLRAAFMYIQYGKGNTKKICELLIDAMLKAPMNQTLLKAIRLTPKQKSEINALVASLKKTPIKGLHPDTRRLIVENVMNSFKRRNFIEAQIIEAQIPLREAQLIGLSQNMRALNSLKQELLDYLKRHIEQQIKENPRIMERMSQYPNTQGITWDEAFGTFEPKEEEPAPSTIAEHARGIEDLRKILAEGDMGDMSDEEVYQLGKEMGLFE